MYRVVPLGRSPQVRTLLIAFVLLGLMGLVIPSATSHSGALAAPTGSHAGIAASTAITPHAVASHPSTTPVAGISHSGSLSNSAILAHAHPAGTGTGVFWSANSSWSNQSFNNAGCSWYSFSGFFDSTCYDQAVQPTILNLANGDIAVVYSIYTNSSGTQCLGSATSVNERVAFSVSSDGGQTFGPIQYLGNLTCTYLDAIEPSFAVATDGTIYGAYVEYNQTGNQGQYTARGGGGYYCYYCYGGSTPADALGFTWSTDNGTTFSAPVTLNMSGNISKPQVAVFGDTVYVLFENFTNGTTSIPFAVYGYGGYPISENLLVSTDRGVTWSGPTPLPATNSGSYYDELGASIAVTPSGLLAAAYFTNHGCVANTSYGSCWANGDDLVYTTSTTNGTTWAPLVTVYAGVGEYQYYPDGYYLNAYFQVVPQAQLAFDSSGTTAMITWAGGYNKTMLAGTSWTYYYNYEQAGIFAAVGSSSGTGWTTSALQTPINNNDYDQFYNPSIGSWGGTIYVAYTGANSTGCYGTCTSFLDGTYAEWLRTSTNGGLTWTYPTLLDYSNTCYFGNCQTYQASNSFSGFGSSIGFTATGTPLISYALPWGFSYSYAYVNGTSYYNYTYPTKLSIATPWYGSTVTVNFTENNLAPGTPWSFGVDGQVFSTTDSYFTVTNIPMADNVILQGFPFQAGYGTQAAPTFSVPTLAEFTGDATVYVNFSLTFLLNLGVEPTNPYDVNVYFYDPLGNYNYIDIYTNCYTGVCVTNNYTNSPTNWYFPAGTTFEIQSYAYPGGGLSYWTGAGNGSHTGPGTDANITMNSQINETGWLGGFGIYNLSVAPQGLPSTSTYYFTLDGVQYSGLATSPVNVSGVPTGAHEITNVWADSTTAGWEYFGLPSPADPVLVPTETSVALTFSLVDVGAATGTVSFQAQGLTTGTSWNFEFNGTIYNSQTPWINVTTHPGTYGVKGFPIVALNASVGYTPTGVGPTLSVSTGATYMVDYVPAYKVQVIAGVGGGVTGGTGSFWVASGTPAQFIATAHSGYAFGGWTGTGLGSYTGLSSFANITVNGPIVQTASFYPLPASRFNLTFTETGLTPGTWWTVFLAGFGYSSNQSSFLIQGLLSCSSPGGSYNLTVPYAYSNNELTRFVPTSHLPHAICTTGSTVENEVFAAQYLLTLQSTAGGFAEAQIGPNTVTTSVWVPTGTSVALSAVGQTGYDFLGWNGTGLGAYTGPGLTQGIIMAGPVSELATFSLHVNPPAPTFTMTFHETLTLASGTVWGIVLGGIGYSSSSSTLSVSGLHATTYPLTVTTALSPDGLTRYTTLGNVASVTVSHNATVLISYTTSFWVSITGTPGGVTSPGSAWVTSGGSILLNVTVLDGFQFLGWNGTGGAAAYSGPVAATSITVTSPISEVATFAPLAQTVSTGSSTSSIWSQPSTWIGLGIVGLLVGLVVGLVVSRRSGRQPPMAPASYEAPPASDGAPADMSPPDGGSA